MNLDAANISLAHVHAYVDAQLDDNDCARLEEYFDVNPEKFEQLQQYLAINDHYQTRYESVLQEPIPQSMFERVYAENHEPFQSTNRGFHRMSETISSVLFDKPSVWISALNQRVHALLRLDRIEQQSWFIRLKSMISTEEGQAEGALTKFFKALKIHPQSAPAWINRLANHLSALLIKMNRSFGEVNLFATGSIVAIGIVIGVLVSNNHDNVINEPANQGHAESQAIQAHLFYRKEGRSALETDKDSQHDLLNWVSGRLGMEIRLVDFSELGYSNAGLMLVPAMSNFAMVTVYENDQGQKLTLYVGLRDGGKSDDVICAARENTKSLCSWTNDKLRFVVVSDLTVTDTKQLAVWMQQNYAMAHLISSSEYFFSQTLGTIKA